MKIVAVSMVKNESDIIESFIRNTLKYVDQMLVLDHFSTDGTREILEFLKSEGLPLIIENAMRVDYVQSLIMTELIYKAKDILHGDLILPIDADEFILPTSSDFRKKLHTYSPEYVYLIPSFITIPLNYNKEEFLLSGTHIQSLQAQEMKKIMIGRHVLDRYHLGIAMGNHNLDVSNRIRKKIIYKKADDFYYAHFQIRSEKQYISKITNGWLTTLARPKKKIGEAFHWQKAFDIIKKRNITKEDMITFLSDSGAFTKKENIEFSSIPKEIIQYSDKICVDPFRSVLATSEKISMEYSKNRTEGKPPTFFVKELYKSIFNQLRNVYYRKIKGIPIERF